MNHLLFRQDQQDFRIFEIINKPFQSLFREAFDIKITSYFFLQWPSEIAHLKVQKGKSHCDGFETEIHHVGHVNPV